MGARARVAISLAAILSLPGCISFNYIQTYRGEPIPPEVHASLTPEQSDLDECLATLGAPELIWPSEDGAFNLAWAWIDSTDWGITASFAAERFLSVSLDFDSESTQVQSVVLQFDEDLRLARLSRGYLWDLAPSAQRGGPASRMVRNTPR